ncbi:hypothetical protein [Sulfurospirillum barnesii]|uniref:Uncharacterized protein n=1 Tax=Sulfurospirillum barnesii (strain ATCC 700032 / DSM 10660 / SES-3) TaxID=760154 RepID=I3XY13_SULBS|nr:hypothetical protein [Sulfurospirillum barnesii]AFL68837.1 hypothetical protein Sulba_1549 [Sulfurospirillum barnesii SES-3]
MTSNDVLLDDALLLVEQNFYFLHMGEFLGKLSKTEDLLDRSLFVVKKYEEGQAYYFNAQIIQELLINARQTDKDTISLFEYFVEFNAFRGMCMAMVESLRFESSFKTFMQELFKEQYENFFDILSFVRNVLSHNIHSEICLSEKDYDGTLKRIRRMSRNPNIAFSFQYALNLPELGAPNDAYVFTCKIDFEALCEGMPFLEILSMFDLLMLSELCFNLVMTYRMQEEKEFREDV